MSSTEELDEEIDAQDEQINLGIFGVARRIILFGMENLLSLIVDADQEPPQIRWPEAWDLFKERMQFYSNLPERDAMMYSVSDAMEQLAPSLTLERIDEGLRKSPFRLKLLVGAGLTAAHMALKMQPEKVTELSEEGETLVLLILNHPSTIEAFEVLRDRPKLLSFITKYVFYRLGIPYMEKTVNPSPPLATTDAQPQSP